MLTSSPESTSATPSSALPTRTSLPVTFAKYRILLQFFSLAIFYLLLCMHDIVYFFRTSVPFFSVKKIEQFSVENAMFQFTRPMSTPGNTSGSFSQVWSFPLLLLSTQSQRHLHRPPPLIPRPNPLNHQQKDPLQFLPISSATPPLVLRSNPLKHLQKDPLQFPPVFPTQLWKQPQQQLLTRGIMTIKVFLSTWWRRYQDGGWTIFLILLLVSVRFVAQPTTSSDWFSFWDSFSDFWWIFAVSGSWRWNPSELVSIWGFRRLGTSRYTSVQSSSSLHSSDRCGKWAQGLWGSEHGES